LSGRLSAREKKKISFKEQKSLRKSKVTFEKEDIVGQMD